MQAAMNRLSAFVRTRRKLVLITWLLLVVASVPLMSQQTKHLTSGGFEVPGSGSSEVDKALSRFHHEQGEGLGIVLQGKGGDLSAAVDRVVAVAKPIEHAEVAPEAAEAAKQAAAQQEVVVIPLAVSGVADDILQAAKDLREELKVGEVEDGVQAYVVGQQALWAGMQELQKEDLEHARADGLPGDPDRAPGRVRHRARRAAAGRAGRRRRGRDRRDHLPAQPRDDDVGVRHEHHLDARHRRGRGLQPVRAEPLPRGGAPRARTAPTRWTPPCAPPARPSSSPA